MKKFAYSVFIFIFAGFLSCASSPAKVQAGSSVWKVSRYGNTVFLGGSIHILRNEDFPLPKEFDSALSQSTMLALEADTGQLADENIAQYLAIRMFLPAGTTIKTLLDSDTYGLLKAKLEEYGVPIEGDVSRLKPSMIMNVLTMLEMQRYGFVEHGVDAYYFEKAKDAKKPVEFLETVQMQIDMLVTMGDGYENDFVKYSLKDMGNTESELVSIVSEWKTGEAAATEKALLEMREQWPVLYKTLVTDRNSAWMPKIQGYLASGSRVFIIAGLAHLHGPDGLLRQLADSGCSIEQYTPK
jgi:uncharacterized protein YbaP (TraB family)